MVKILVVDDSALMRRIVCDIIDTDSNLEVVDVSIDGLDAYNKIKNGTYDIVILDMILPRMSGLDVLTKLKEENIKCPTTILISSTLKEDAEATLLAMERGAVDFIVKPFRSDNTSRNDFAEKLLSSIKVVATHHLGIRYSQTNRLPTPTATQVVRNPGKTLAQNAELFTAPKRVEKVSGRKLIAIACSTGGPQALHEFVPMLPGDLPYPVILTQHMPPGFTASLATRLNTLSAISVKEAEEGDELKAGWVYIAPGGKHLEITEKGSRLVCHLSDEPPVGNLKPCADIMYRSLASIGFEEIICVVLTGMGADGTAGIKFIKQYHNIYTISQNEETCVVYGMPKSVAQAGLSDEVVPLKEVAKSITRKLGV